MLELVEIIKSKLEDIKSQLERAKKGISSQDYTNLNSYLCSVIIQGITIYYSKCTGVPSKLAMKYGTEGGIKKWKQILLTIKQAFELLHQCCEGSRFYFDYYSQRDRKILRRLRKMRQELKPITKKEFLLIERGWKLFKEYFLSLWD